VRDVQPLAFQTAATVVPTVAIAVAISGKFFLPSTYDDKVTYPSWLAGWIKEYLWLVALLFLAFAVRAERVAMGVLARGSGTPEEWSQVKWSLIIMAVIGVVGVAVPSVAARIGTSRAAVDNAKEHAPVYVAREGAQALVIFYAISFAGIAAIALWT
jgi:hypothetical protein